VHVSLNEQKTKWTTLCHLQQFTRSGDGDSLKFVAFHKIDALHVFPTPYPQRFFSAQHVKRPKIDMSDLETYISTTNSNSDKAAKLKAQAANKPERLQLVN
ncbi:hypothetical protein Tco_1527469, partial [Tanacetum coccineum]